MTPGPTKVCRRGDHHDMCGCNRDKVVLRPLDCVYSTRPVAESHLVAHGPKPVRVLLLLLLHAAFVGR